MWPSGPGGAGAAAQSAAAAAAAAAHAARDMPWSAAANLAAPGPAALPSSAYNQAYYAALHANMASAAQAQLAAAMAPPPQPPPPAVVTSGMSLVIRTKLLIFITDHVARLLILAGCLGCF